MFENRRVFLKEFAVDLPTLDNFGVEDVAITEVPEGQIVVKSHTLSVDAWIRTTLSDAGMHARSNLGQTIRAFGVGEVVASTHPDWQVGDWAYGLLCAQTHALLEPDGLQKVTLEEGIDPAAIVGPLGITTGLTAWVGLIAVGEMKAGETVLVSGAAGAVGSCVVQLAKSRGAHVIGIAGGAEKCAYLTSEVGADAAIDYKQGNVTEQIAATAPDGIEVFFDNVGGDILDSALDNLRPTGGARIAICGAISQYENLDDVQGPKLYLRLAERNASMRGFVVSHHAARFPEAVEEISALLRSGNLALHEHAVEGVENFPEALLMLYAGKHFGNLVVRA
ncbi:NADP-dependent oxidoreductase [Parerythrobacter jejuensis]|uniref:Zinc-binding dehydrogenase n=1 Tax=Parerythrobacter jejuensis TaxID=795812 RepID=A0A845ATF8_9SPHN|nr:NADP-dependent oxidoreductase [Parerythrobacter jejuensis]MXP32884.1 zinc-binding dehydrogenase [Parerythrobacter jejuensis]